MFLVQYTLWKMLLSNTEYEASDYWSAQYSDKPSIYEQQILYKCVASFYI